jgi:hypothetical protein
MARHVWILAIAALSALVSVTGAVAQDAKSKGKTSFERRGGYSYNQAQSINTYGDARGKYGAANSLRDPNIDRQTNSGAGAGQHGGNAPFLH